jgi:polyisoprenoid-binding protein YceI
MKELIRLGIILLFTLLTISGAAQATDYVVDPERSELVVQLFREGLAAVLAHDHVIRATEFSGEARSDADNPSTASMWVEVRADSLRADEPEIRAKYGLQKPISDKDRRKIQATMESERQMDVEKFPLMKFQSVSIEELSDGQYTVTGDLTIHGVTRSVTFPATATEENGAFRGRVSIRFNQSDFGITPISIMLGAIRNRDEAVLHADIVFTPRPAAPSPATEP